MSSQLTKHIPKRATNDKKKAKRARSWTKAQKIKADNIRDNDVRRKHNIEVGSTGKQRRYNPNYQTA